MHMEDRRNFESRQPIFIRRILRWSSVEYDEKLPAKPLNRVGMSERDGVELHKIDFVVPFSNSSQTKHVIRGGEILDCHLNVHTPNERF